MKRIATFVLVAVIGLSCSGSRRLGDTSNSDPYMMTIQALIRGHVGQEVTVYNNYGLPMTSVYLGSTTSIEVADGIKGEHVMMITELGWQIWYPGGPTMALVKPEEISWLACDRGWVMADGTWKDDGDGQYVWTYLYDPRTNYRELLSVVFALPEDFLSAAEWPELVPEESEKIHQYFFPEDQ